VVGYVAGSSNVRKQLKFEKRMLGISEQEPWQVKLHRVTTRAGVQGEQFNEYVPLQATGVTTLKNSAKHIRFIAGTT
jgi:hypothetical protein